MHFAALEAITVVKKIIKLFWQIKKHYNVSVLPFNKTWKMRRRTRRANGNGNVTQKPTAPSEPKFGVLHYNQPRILPRRCQDGRKFKTKVSSSSSQTQDPVT